MNVATGSSRRSAVVAALPGLLIALTVVDDAVFGSGIVAARLAFGTPGLLAAAGGFVALSVAMAAATAWSLRRAPIRLSPRWRARLERQRSGRFGRYLLPHPDRLVTTAVGAVVFGSVLPLVVASLDDGDGDEGGAASRGRLRRIVLVSGIAYGIAFASGYGLAGALVGAAT